MVDRSQLSSALFMLSGGLRLLGEVLEAESQATAAPPAPVADSGRLVGPREVGVSPTTWRRAVRSGELPAVRIGRELKARRGDVDAWLERHAVSPTTATPAPATPAAPGDEIARLLASGRLRSLPGGRK